MHTLTIVTLGSGDSSLLTKQADHALQTSRHLILRTSRHPVVSYLDELGVQYTSLDTLYEKDEDFDQLNCECAKIILAACKQQDVCYAVSDILTDATVAALQELKQNDIEIRILPGISHAERCIALLGITCGTLRMCSATDFMKMRVTPEEPLLLTELYSRECAGECKLKLTALMPEEMTVGFVTGSENTGKLKLTQIPLYELDRQKKYDHLTAAYIAPVSYLERSRYDMDDLMEVVSRLRAPDGCPWDREQTHESILPDLLEECYEYIQTVRDQDPDAMYDELGDVLFQVAMHATIARQFDEFELNDVTSAICGKMIERHPHVFGNVKADTSEQVLDNWEAQKREKRNLATTADAMRNVSKGLSSLLRSYKVQKKAVKAGFAYRDIEQAIDKVREELSEVENASQDKQQEELGDLLFAVVSVCYLQSVDPDIALYAATEKFIDRFDKMEAAISADGKSLTGLVDTEILEYWNQAKQ